MIVNHRVIIEGSDTWFWSDDRREIWKAGDEASVEVLYLLLDDRWVLEVWVATWDGDEIDDVPVSARILTAREAFEWLHETNHAPRNEPLPDGVLQEWGDRHRAAGTAKSPRPHTSTKSPKKRCQLDPLAMEAFELQRYGGLTQKQIALYLTQKYAGVRSVDQPAVSRMLKTLREYKESQGEVVSVKRIRVRACDADIIAVMGAGKDRRARHQRPRYERD
jgi:hypothetical protein